MFLTLLFSYIENRFVWMVKYSYKHKTKTYTHVHLTSQSIASRNSNRLLAFQPVLGPLGSQSKY